MVGKYCRFNLISYCLYRCHVDIRRLKYRRFNKANKTNKALYCIAHFGSHLIHVTHSSLHSSVCPFVLHFFAQLTCSVSPFRYRIFFGSNFVEDTSTCKFHQFCDIIFLHPRRFQMFQNASSQFQVMK